MTTETTLQPPALRGTQLRVELGGRTLLNVPEVVLPAGRWTSVVGPNGAGKSTLLKVLAGLWPGAGQVALSGRPLSAWGRKPRARHLAWLGQNEVAAEDLRVYDVAMLGRLPHQTWMAPPTQADHQAVARALQATQAWDWRDRPLGALSGGERQRVLLARALAVQAEVYLMDEPLANLDPPHQADWLLLVRALVAQGKTVVSVLHELGLALQADHLLVLAAGQVQHAGPCAARDTHRALEQVFEYRIRVESLSNQWIVLFN